MLALLGTILVAGVAGIFGASVSKPPPGLEIAATALQDAALIATSLLFA